MPERPIATNELAIIAKRYGATPDPNNPRAFDIPNDKLESFRADVQRLKQGATINAVVGSWNAADRAKEANPEAPPLSAGTANRFVQGLAQNLNPLAAVSAIGHAVVPESVARWAGAERPETFGPLNTASGLLQAQANEFRKGNAAPTMVERIGHYAAGALPIVGPAAARAGERIAGGDVAGGLGEAVGLIGPTVVEGALRPRDIPGVGKYVASSAATTKRATQATALERQAVEDVANQVLNPANAKMRGTARYVAPKMLEKTSGYTGDRMMDMLHAEDKMAEAVTKIDDAISQTGGQNTPINTQPILDALNTERENLLTNRREIIKGRSVTQRVPMVGKEGQVAELDRIIAEIENASSGMMGKGTKSAYFNELKPLRDNYYEQANKAGAYRRMGNVSLDDAGWAAREGGTAIQDAFANAIPGLADANKEYHLHKSVHEVLNPLEGNPRSTKMSQGQTGGLATVGFAIGQNFGKAGALVGSKIWPQLVEIMNSPKFKFVSAQRKMELAEAIRSGQPGKLQRAIFNTSRALRVGAAADAQEQE